MTGSEIASALTERLRTALPQADVRMVYDGDFSRKPARPVVCVGLLREAVTDGAGSVKLVVWLYTAERRSAVDLFEAVCTALAAIPCTVRSVARGEMQYDGALRCMVTPCTVEASSNAAAENRVALEIGGAACTADSVSVERETKTLRFGSVGEEAPHTVADGPTVYRLTITGLAAPETVVSLAGFAVCVSGVRYAPCVWKKLGADRVELEAGGAQAEAETETEAGAYYGG